MNEEMKMQNAERENALSSYTVPAVPESAPLAPLSRRDWLCPLLALLLAALYWSVFGVERMLDSSFGPGIGITAYVCAYFVAVFLVLGKRSYPRSGLLFMAAALLLSLSCALYSALGLTVLNCFLILALSAAATFRLSGHALRDWRDARIIPESLTLSFHALTKRLGRPLEALRLWKQNDRGVWCGLLWGLLLAIPVLLVVLALLASADVVFAGLFEGLAAWFEEIGFGSLVWRLFRWLLLALFLCSGLYFLGDKPTAPAARQKTTKQPSALPFLATTLLLDAVYILFVVIQLRHLFGGWESAQMAGGWAEYARSGFFQLVGVTVLNLAVCLLPASEERYASKGGLVLRIGGGVMTLLSFVILASAAWRIRLYIQAFGLSVLRVLTVWGIVLIALLLVAAAYKLWRPKFRFFQILIVLGVSGWCLVCLLGPTRMCANYNVNAYLDGRLSEVDISYMDTPECLPALYRLGESEPGYPALANKTVYLEELADWRDHYAFHWGNWRFADLYSRDR